MSSTKIVCTAAAGLLAIGQFAHLPADRRAAFWATLSGIAGGRDAPAPAAPRVARLSEPAGTGGPSPQAAVGSGSLVVPPDAHGQFSAMAEAEGFRFPVLVDTGATFVCLTFEDAERLGLRPPPSDFRHAVGTANGQAAYARTELREIRLGTLAVRQLSALIAPRGALGRTLLGMTFLSRLKGYRVDGGRLVLEP